MSNGGDTSKDNDDDGPTCADGRIIHGESTLCCGQQVLVLANGSRCGESCYSGAVFEVGIGNILKVTSFGAAGFRTSVKETSATDRTQQSPTISFELNELNRKADFILILVRSSTNPETPSPTQRWSLRVTQTTLTKKFPQPVSVAARATWTIGDHLLHGRGPRLSHNFNGGWVLNEATAKNKRNLQK